MDFDHTVLLIASDFCGAIWRTKCTERNPYVRRGKENLRREILEVPGDESFQLNLNGTKSVCVSSDSNFDAS
jgi:hypothetical protein